MSKDVTSAASTAVTPRRRCLRLDPISIFCSFKSRKTKTHQDHMGNVIPQERYSTPPFGQTEEHSSKNSRHSDVGTKALVFVTPMPIDKRIDMTKNDWFCRLCSFSWMRKDKDESLNDVFVQHFKEAHLKVFCDFTDFIGTDKAFQVTLDDKDYDDVNQPNGFYYSCEEKFENEIDVYFHYINCHCLTDHCDICGRWLSSRRGNFSDHLKFCHRIKDFQTCPESCRLMKDDVNLIFRHVIENHTKIVHACIICLLNKQQNSHIKYDTHYPSREKWLQHIITAHPGKLVPDALVKYTRLHKIEKQDKSFLNSYIDCIPCQRTGMPRDQNNKYHHGLRTVRCKSIEVAIDHAFEDIHSGNVYICAHCRTIRKYTDLKHFRECLYSFYDFFESKNLRNDKKLWYAFNVTFKKRSFFH